MYFVYHCVFIACSSIVTWWGGPGGIEAWFLGLLLPSVLWHCWLGHLTHENPSPMWPIICLHTHTHNCFTALFPGPPGWAGARRELLDFVVQGKINRGRHTDHPAGRHSIRTNQCPPPSSPHFLQAECPSCRPTNSVKALKATSTFGLGRRR